MRERNISKYDNINSAYRIVDALSWSPIEIRL